MPKDKTNLNDIVGPASKQVPESAMEEHPLSQKPVNIRQKSNTSN